MQCGFDGSEESARPTVLLCRCSLLILSSPSVSLSVLCCTCPGTASHSTVEACAETATYPEKQGLVWFLTSHVVSSRDNYHRWSFFSSLCEVLFWYDIDESLLIMIQRWRILLSSKMPVLVYIYFNCGKVVQKLKSLECVLANLRSVI